MGRTQYRLGGRYQEGATAVEFAFVLPVFFLLFYGMLVYGFILLMRMGLQHAAEDGVRAALRYPVGMCASPCDEDTQRRFQIGARLEAAQTVALQQARWMDRRNRDALQVISSLSRSCNASGADCDGEPTTVVCSTPSCVVDGVVPNCGSGLAEACQVIVEVHYDYQRAPFIPGIEAFGLLTPQRLAGQARMLIDGRAL